MPLELHAPVAAQGIAQQPHLALELGRRVLPEPLEGGEGLGDEAADRHGDRRSPVVTATDLHAPAGQLGDAEGVLVGLGGQAGHEVQLHPPPPLGVGGFHRSVEVVVGNELVDDPAHAPRAGFGGEGQAGAAGLLQLGGDAHGEGVDPQRRQRHRHLAAVGGVGHGGGDHSLDPAEVGGRQRGQRHLVVAGAPQAVGDHAPDLGLGPLAHGPGDHARLTEATAPGAAPEDLHVEPVVDHLGERHQLALRVRPVAEVGDGALLHPLGYLGMEGVHTHEVVAVVGRLVH